MTSILVSHIATIEGSFCVYVICVGVHVSLKLPCGMLDNL